MDQSLDSSHLRATRAPEPFYERGTSAILRAELERWLRRIRFDDLEPELSQPAAEPRRSYIRLPSGPSSEAWLISWPAGSCAPLHDHGVAQGMAAVLSGELLELRFLRDSQRWAESRWQPGAIIELAARTCHEVHNVSDHMAYSLHVYSPRLDSMTYYGRTADGRIHPLRSEAAHQW
jgi:hypothetical protein